ncbi:hydantoinase B/oxoprolinase family protein [Terrarubrum flagellatum]|uniref:hydantoinase B/oxoprolinase family protein n=1 Tax=Terrirubrum flagellatum TaxID=2895980 RepID=UPI0031455770
MRRKADYDPIALGVQWDRLISIADEIVSTLVRASFSTNVRESYDLSCVIFDAAGRALAQGRYSVPSFTGTAQMTLQHLLAAHPAATLRPGDVLMTNDPWLGTGHLFDINVAQPIWRKGVIIGYVMSITHLPDIGGIGFSATAREIYEEGLRLPPAKFIREGVIDPVLRAIIETNVRVPQQTMGDIMANVACTTAGGRMVNELMDEYGVADLTPLADAILLSSERSLSEALRETPEGVYANRIDIEGVQEALTLACEVTIREGQAHIDLTGCSPSVGAAINVPLCYSRAMALHAIKCLMTPSIPNNEGSARPISMSAPEGCVLNAAPPSATGGRHIIGHFIQPLIFGALADALPEKAQADSGMLNLINVQGRNRRGEGVSSIFFASGGFGALKGIDGAATTPSPSNMTSTPVEVWEDITGLRVISKTLLADSGGAGQFRGGLGQRIEMINDTEFPMTISCLAGRTEFPPLGMLGGQPGARRRVEINGVEVHPKGRYILAPGDTIVTYEAGGGGYGDPRLRDAAVIRRDIEEGFVTRRAAPTNI